MEQIKAEKNQKFIRELSLKPDNRVCFDCNAKSTPNIIMDYGIFVCSFCAGVHRNFQHKAKGISMTNFKDPDVEHIKNCGGNSGQAAVYLAEWNSSTYPKPAAYDEKAISAFIKKVFVDKAYVAGASKPNNYPVSQQSQSSVYPDADSSEVKDISSFVKNPPKITVSKKRAEMETSNEQQSSFFQFTEEKKSNITPPKPNQPAAPAKQNMFNFDDDFDNSNAAPQQVTIQKSIQPPQPVKKPVANVEDLFSDFGAAPIQPQQPISNNPFGANRPAGMNPMMNNMNSMMNNPMMNNQMNPMMNNQMNPMMNNQMNPMMNNQMNPMMNNQMMSNQMNSMMNNQMNNQMMNNQIMNNQMMNRSNMAMNPSPMGMNQMFMGGAPKPASAMGMNPFGIQNPFGVQNPFDSNPFDTVPAPQHQQQSFGMNPPEKRNIEVPATSSAKPQPQHQQQSNLFSDLNVFGSAPKSAPKPANSFDDDFF